MKPSRSELLKLLQAGLGKMNFPLTSQSENDLIRYIELIDQNNKLFKLTSIRDVDVMISRHLLDSLSITPHLNGNFILDIGTGAGFPGMPLAIALPDRIFVLLDSNPKKTRFLQQVCTQLRLRNVQVIHETIENYRPKKLFDSVVCRNFGIFPDFLNQIQHVIKPQARILAMKGIYPQTEIEHIKPPFSLINVYPLKIPSLDSDRHAVEVGFETEVA